MSFASASQATAPIERSWFVSDSLDRFEAERSDKPKPLGYVPERGETFSVVDGITLKEFEENFPIEAQPWSSRIPAAIEKAEKLLDGKVRYYDQDLTATEVALAKALWELYPCNDGESHCCDFEPATCQALRDFCTKVESLD